MTILGLTGERPAGEIRLGFRAGWVRTIVLTVGGAGGLGLVFAAFDLAKTNPEAVFGLLHQWGFVWLLGLAAMYFVYDVVKSGVGYLGSLSESVKDSAVAMSRIADKDDRERDRMITETAYIGQRLERMAQEMRDGRAEQQAHNTRVEELVRSLQKSDER